MEQNQNQNQPKKRVVEQTSVYPVQRTYVRSSTPQNTRQFQPGHYYQCSAMGEAKPIAHTQTSQQHFPQMDQQHVHQPMQVAPHQIIQYEYYEPPMTLNAWTQTRPEDFPQSPAPSTSFSALTEAALLARIQELEESLRNCSMKAAAKKENETATYRILAQSDEGTSETQIEIEVSDETENPNSSSPNVYTVNPSSPPMIKQIYGKKGVESAPETNKDTLVSLGPNDTKIPAIDFEKISWASPSIATRKLLTIIFDRQTLATHSMTGKASPAFKDLDKPVKGKLEQNAIQDIIFVVSKKCGVSAKEVRSAITTKCADENKMLKLKHAKRLAPNEPRRVALSEVNKIKKEG